MGPAVGIIWAGLAALAAALEGPGPGPGPSTPDAPVQGLRVVVRARAGEDVEQKVLARLRGHASDLPITFVVDAADGRPAGGGDDALAWTDAAAVRAGADAAVWLSHGPCEPGAPAAAPPATTDLIVHIAQARTRSVLVRAVGRVACQRAGEGGAHAAEESAAFEAAAIVVRGALLAVSEGGTIGVVPAAPPAARARAAPDGLQPRLGAGGLWTLDGLSPHGQPGLQARLGWSGERLGFELGLLATIPSDLVDEYATLTLSRAALTAGAAWRQPLGARWFADAALHAGVVLQMRTTTPRQPGVTADPASRFPSAMVAPEGRLGLSIPGVPGLSTSLALAADYIPFIARIEYTDSTTKMVVSERRPWVLQPRASINIELASP
ncbi:MAG TPA: hypothetical protein VMU50_20680 [Polyangia bacterium]|nr:hypothetical protein [Polyangia bacterium]